MNQETKRIILDHLNEWLEERKLNTVDLKTSGHLPVSGRWVDSLRKSVRDKDNAGFYVKKVKALLDKIELPYEMDGSQVVLDCLSTTKKPKPTKLEIALSKDDLLSKWSSSNPKKSNEWQD